MPIVKLFQIHESRIFLTIIFIVFFTCNIFSQNTYLPLNHFSYELISRKDITDTSVDFSTTIKPYLRSDLAEYLQQTDFANDHLLFSKKELFNNNYLEHEMAEFYDNNDSEKGKLLKYFYKQPNAFYSVNEKDFFLYLNPVLYNTIGLSNNTSFIKYQNTRGIELRGGIDKKIGFYFFAIDNQVVAPDYVNERIDEMHVMPGEGRIKPFKIHGVDYLSARGYIAFNATKHISIQFGQDKIFIGDGIRSLIWSDQSKDFLFLKLNTHVWKINYQNIFAELSQYNSGYIYDSLIEKKYAAMHHLDIALHPQLHIGLFESVIFNRTDSSGQDSGFDFNYLNPIIFYRSVENALGSPDNVLLGLNWKWNFLHHFSFYGQFVLDEFIFREFFNSNGWWGKKNATQAGIKYVDAFNIPYLDLQYELNVARPYTYSYENNGGSYTHYNQAIAHALGANFQEQLFRMYYQIIPQLIIENTFIYADYGADTSGSNWGGNIFLDYETHELDYGNVIGQGVNNKLLLNNLVLNWQFWHNAFVELNCIYRKNTSEINFDNEDELYLGIGLRLNAPLRRDYF